MLLILRVLGAENLGNIASPNTRKLYDVLWAIYCVIVSYRCLSMCFQTSQYLGPLLHTIQLMLQVVLQFAVILAVFTIGFTCGSIFLYSGSDTYEDTKDGSIFGSFPNAIEFLLESALGVHEFTDVTEELFDQNYTVATMFLILWLIVTAMVLFNLLIALMTTRYDEVKERAKEEAAFLSAQNCYELKNRKRLIPPPFNWIPIAIGGVIHFVNLFTALISPNYLNIYAFLHTKWLNPQRSFLYRGYLHPHDSTRYHEHRRNLRKNKYEKQFEKWDKLNSNLMDTRMKGISNGNVGC